MITKADDALTLPMPVRPLGRTGWEASLLTLGGVKWDGHLPEGEAIALIRRALELGVNTFDTAPVYSSGESERRLGKALEDRREGIWITTKTTKRSRGEAQRDIDASLERLRTDHVDMLFVHALDDDDDYEKVMAAESVLRLLEDYRSAGHVRHIGVSGHWYRHNMLRIVREYPFDAVLVPVGLFNLAYDYSYVDEIIPAARNNGIGVMGMKVFGAGRVKHASSIEPYLRYSLNLDIDSAVIGCDSIAQLEQTVSIIKRGVAPLPEAERDQPLAEAREVTQSWDAGEFNWVSHYQR